MEPQKCTREQSVNELNQKLSKENVQSLAISFHSAIRTSPGRSAVIDKSWSASLVVGCPEKS